MLFEAFCKPFSNTYQSVDPTEPGGDPNQLIDHIHDNSNIHPNDAGMIAFANRITSKRPDHYILQYFVPRGVTRFRANLAVCATDAGGWLHRFP